MFAIMETGGKQYRAAIGDVLDLELLDATEGDVVEFDRVLLVSDENGTRVGTPLIEGAVVKGQLRGQMKGPKLTVFKMKRRKKQRQMKGHRQRYSRVEITAIEG